MRHCCQFDAHDIWYLKDTDEFCNRTLFIGVCPVCNKNLVNLYQKNIKTDSVFYIKKVGDTAIDFVRNLSHECVYSRNSINKMNLKPKPYGWKYGINKQKKSKNGEVVIEQYSADFFGNKELIKKNNKIL
ncbi:hypothetical protein J6O48_07220 [bacterium]|nr:hypothetical protein [bacterium]